MNRFKFSPLTKVRVCITTKFYEIMTDLYITSHLPGKMKEREPYVEGIPFQTGIKPSMKVIPLFFEKNTGTAQESEYPKSGVKILKPILCSALLDHILQFLF